MKRKTTEISINTSSGAEKVERIEKEQAKSGAEKTSVKKTVKKAPVEDSAKAEAALGNAEKQKVGGKAEQESQAAKARVAAAIQRKEAQEKKKSERKERAARKAEARKKRLAERKAVIEKRAADKKARAEKHAAERKALAEKRKAEKEEKLRQRAHAKANRHNENYKKKKAKAKTRSERRTSREGRNKSYGGWLAAVVSLGVVTLALATTVTIGAIEMNKSNSAMMGTYRSTMYELTGIMENVDDDLDRVRISNSPAQQSRILTDILVQTRLAELDLEKLPVAAEADRNVTSFINHTAAESQRMLGKLQRGEGLSEKDKEILETLYQTNHSVRAELDQLVASMTDKDLTAYLKDGMGSLKDSFDRIEKSTLPENAPPMKGAGMQSIAPKTMDKDKSRVEASTAEGLCLEYFTGYSIAEFQCVGETVGDGYEAYNIQGYDEKGNQLFAEISQRDGTLLRFDYYEDCSSEAFDVRSAELIAEEFLEKLGYDDMEVVRYRSNGSTADFTFVYEDDDVLYYPDEIRVKVCRSRGVVSGLDVTKYVRNHRDREDVEVKLNLAQAQSKLREGLAVESSRLTVVQTVRGERTAYEFLCAYGEDKYLVYVDAVNGDEISIVNVKSVA